MLTGGFRLCLPGCGARLGQMGQGSLNVGVGDGKAQCVGGGIHYRRALPSRPRAVRALARIDSVKSLVR